MRNFMFSVYGHKRDIMDPAAKMFGFEFRTSTEDVVDYEGGTHGHD